ncbi:hypothetical protein [Roseimicrobium gellanilyticum]|nr:hypothetical protein [Roseimicrobium gellanilyticum]
MKPERGSGFFVPGFMKALIDIIDWEYPETREAYRPTVWDLSDKDEIYKLVLVLGNGVILELRAEADSEEVLRVLRGLFKGVGSCEQVTLTDKQKQRLWYYYEGDECYEQRGKNPGYMMIDPVPRPEKFGASGHP